VRYHDEEWGVPVYDDRLQFEFLVLESAQAGLSWLTILKKREHYRAAFAGFDPQEVARFGEAEVERLLGNAGIVRNRRKIEAAINNARRFLELQEEYGSFSRYIWSFQGGEPIVNSPERLEQVPASTELSERIARELKRRGFRFLGPTILYAHMQAVGMVNDHLRSCFRYAELLREPR
jgi:DNA-3-methyladenine glycosylase I